MGGALPPELAEVLSSVAPDVAREVLARLRKDTTPATPTMDSRRGVALVQLSRILPRLTGEDLRAAVDVLVCGGDGSPEDVAVCGQVALLLMQCLARCGALGRAAGAGQ